MYIYLSLYLLVMSSVDNSSTTVVRMGESRNTQCGSTPILTTEDPCCARRSQIVLSDCDFMLGSMKVLVVQKVLEIALTNEDQRRAHELLKTGIVKIARRKSTSFGLRG